MCVYETVLCHTKKRLHTMVFRFRVNISFGRIKKRKYWWLKILLENSFYGICRTFCNSTWRTWIFRKSLRLNWGTIKVSLTGTPETCGCGLEFLPVALVMLPKWVRSQISLEVIACKHYLLHPVEIYM